MKSYQASEVFGITSELPLNYVERSSVDQVFKRALTQSKHIVIHGGSKQGKTSLRKRHLKDDNLVIVVCQNRWSVSDLFLAILKQSGFRIEVSSKRAAENRSKVSAFFESTFGVSALAKAGGKVGSELESKGSQESTTKPFELDPADANDVIEVLKSVNYDKHIVLEDFHYLPEETQKDFAYAAKAFFDASKIRFVIVGVWKEADRLASYNGDLRLRITNVNADDWSEDELRKVIASGEKLLNVEFSNRFKDALITSCFSSVAIVQEACYRVCERTSIASTCSPARQIRSPLTAEDTVKAIVQEGAGHFRDFVVNMSAGFQKTQLQVYYWIMSFVMLSGDEQLKRGLSMTEIFSHIKEGHPNEVAMASVTQALKALRSLQAQKNIRPIVIDYDAVNRKLEVTDRSFLIWRGVQTEEEIEELLETAVPAGDH